MQDAMAAIWQDPARYEKFSFMSSFTVLGCKYSKNLWFLQKKMLTLRKFYPAKKNNKEFYVKAN
jgi:hypothetical protein